MSDHTHIQWTDATWNPITGCSVVSAGCRHCYAERQMDQRLGRVRWGAGQPRKRTSAAYWRRPERWNAEPFFECSGCGWRGTAADYKRYIRPPALACCPDHNLTPARRRVFCASLADVFDTEVPVGWLMGLLDLIRRTPNLDWLLLTKRIRNVIPRLGAVAGLAGSLSEKGDKAASETWGMAFDWARFIPPENVWLGASVVTQAEADRDIPKLLATPAATRFIGVEPMLGPVDLSGPLAANALREIDGGPAIDWVIAGGESGPRARPCEVDWIRSIVKQCRAAAVPCFVKQLGAAPVEEGCEPGHVWVGRAPQSLRRIADRAGSDPAEWPADLRVREFPGDAPGGGR